MVANVVGQQQNQSRIQLVAIGFIEIAVCFYERLVERVWRFQVGFSNQWHCMAFFKAAVTSAAVGVRQRAHTCWSGRNKYTVPGLAS